MFQLDEAVGAVLLVLSSASLPRYHVISSNGSYEPRRPLCCRHRALVHEHGSPHKYRIRVTYSAVAVWKELLAVVAKHFYTGQEVLVREFVSHAPSLRDKFRLLQVDTG